MYHQIRHHIVIILVIFFSSTIFATTEKITNELTFSTGLANLSYTETSTELTGENIAERTSGSVSAIIGRLSYKFHTKPNYAFYITGSFPMISSNTGSYFNSAVGVEFFFNELGHQTVLAIEGKEIKLTPTLRFYLGIEGGARISPTLQILLKNKIMALS